MSLLNNEKNAGDTIRLSSKKGVVRLPSDKYAGSAKQNYDEGYDRIWGKKNATNAENEKQS